jgi:heptosyltransferase-2
VALRTDEDQGYLTDPSKILVIQTAFLGDVILTLPLMQAIKDTVPAAQVWALVIPSTAEALAGHPAVTGCLVYDKKGKQRGFSAFGHMVGRVRHECFDLALIPHRSLRSALLPFLAGIPRRIGFWGSPGFFLFTHRVSRRQEIHEVDRNLDLWRVLGHRPQLRPPGIYPRGDDRRRARDFLVSQSISEEQDLVGVAPGSVWPTKRWLPEGFARVIRDLREKTEAQIVLLGSSADRALCLRIARQAGGEIPVAAGELTLLPAAALMERCRLVLSNDSAAAHLAAAVGRPVVAIFGPTVPEFGYSPFGQGHVIVQAQANCRPCGRHGGRRCPQKTFHCMTQITSQQVLDAVVGVLEREKKDHC